MGGVGYIILPQKLHQDLSKEWSEHVLNLLKVGFSVAQTDIFDKLQIIKHFHINLKK